MISFFKRSTSIRTQGQGAQVIVNKEEPGHGLISPTSTRPAVDVTRNTSASDLWSCSSTSPDSHQSNRFWRAPQTQHRLKSSKSSPALAPHGGFNDFFRSHHPSTAPAHCKEPPTSAHASPVVPFPTRATPQSAKAGPWDGFLARRLGHRASSAAPLRPINLPTPVSTRSNCEPSQAPQSEIPCHIEKKNSGLRSPDSKFIRTPRSPFFSGRKRTISTSAFNNHPVNGNITFSTDFSPTATFSPNRSLKDKLSLHRLRRRVTGSSDEEEEEEEDEVERFYSTVMVPLEFPTEPSSSPQFNLQPRPTEFQPIHQIAPLRLKDQSNRRTSGLVWFEFDFRQPHHV